MLLAFHSVRKLAENNQITSFIQSPSVWIGLHRNLWSDRSFYLFQNWAAGQPDSASEMCTAANMDISGGWSDENCSLSLPFICYTSGNVSNLVSHITLIVPSIQCLCKMLIWEFIHNRNTTEVNVFYL